MYIVFDGGNHGHNVQAGYGSFKIFDSKGGELLHHAQLEYSGFMTNNEAEYKTLLEALRYARDHYLMHMVLDIEGDSELVRNQVLGNWQVKASHLRPYVEAIQHHLRRYSRVTYLHVPRAEIVRILGH